MGNTLKILKAGNGDSLIIRFLGNDEKYKNIIIDGGNKKSEYEAFLKSEILEIRDRNENIDLLILTHTDQDHVKGIQYLLNDSSIDNSLIKCIWFNSFEESNFQDNNDISYLESCKIQGLIKDSNIPRKNNIIINEFEVLKFFGAQISLLSPLEEDLNKLIDKNSHDISSEANDYDYTVEELINKNPEIFKNKNEELDFTIENRVSIALLIEVNNKSIFLLGDANPDVVENSVKKLIKLRGIERLRVDLIKLSHHASKRSLSLQLMEMIDSNYFIVSTNGKKSNLPNKLTFAKVLNRPYKNGEKDFFIFNYDEVVDNLKFTNNDFERYNFSCLKPNYKNGYIVDL
ncbi:ComEC/Rec2 family competence protein [Flavobacterium inviolabile]|uniref:ComEC/Rec2 family competence protein n=1 Tax=Flavobacterium inviolabile TaxID=2748320 RepID=UPI0015AD00C7|nr:MBL fold metallo-hydrolase [Flavobacterium inviolabile]